MKMTATIELEFESVGETTDNAMDQALIRGLEALKKGIELRETGTPRRTSKTDSAKWNSWRKPSHCLGAHDVIMWNLRRLPSLHGMPPRLDPLKSNHVNSFC